jgi:hypothetical protein
MRKEKLDPLKQYDDIYIVTYMEYRKLIYTVIPPEELGGS